MSNNNSEECKLSRQELISLYAIFHNLQKQCTDEICKYMSLYFNTNILILGGGILILTAMDNSLFKDAFLVLCGILVIIMSIIFLKSTKRAYYNQMEYIAQTGQIEDLLDFDNKQMFGGQNYFVAEGLMMKRHLNNRRNTTNKDGESTKLSFVNKYVKGGQRKYIVILSWTFVVFGILLSICPFLSRFLGIIL